MLRVKKEGAWYFWTGFLVPVLFVLTGFILIGVWPAGNGTVLIIDSLHQYLPFYTDFHEKLVNHDSLLYSFSAGLGYNFWATYAYYLASPFNFLIALFPTQNVCDFMDLSILLKIGLIGGTFTWYLSKRRSSSHVWPLAFGSLYALSFFLIGYYFNLMWLDSIAMLPLIMKGIEGICRTEDSDTKDTQRQGRKAGISSGILYCASLFYALWCNYYIGFMLCIFAVLYFAACSVMAGRVKARTFFTRSLSFGFFSLLSGAMSAVVLYPAYMALRASEAMQTNSFPAKVSFYDSFIDMLLSHFAAVRPINIANTQAGLNAYCSVSVFLLVFIYLLDGKIRLREKLCHMALIAFLFLSFSMNILNYIWHGFHKQNGIPNRFAFIYIALLMIVCFDSSAHIETMAVWKILLSGLLPIGFAVTAFLLKLGEDYEGNPYDDKVYLITIILLTVYLIVLLILRLRHTGRMLFSFIFSAFLVIEAGCSSVYGIVCNDSVTRDIYLKDQASYKKLMKETGDDDWYRSEVDAQRMRNITMFCGGKAIVMFNSTMQASVTDFCDRIGMEARTNKNGYNGVTSLMNDVLGVRYVLSANGRGSSLYGMRSVSSDGNLTVYKNDDALPAGFLVRSDILDWDIEKGNFADVQNEFVRLATGMDPVFTLDRYIEIEDGEKYGIRIPEKKEVYLCLPSRVKELKLQSPEYNKTYSTYTDHVYCIHACDGSHEASFTCKLNGTNHPKASVYTCKEEDVRAVTASLASRPLYDIVEKGNMLYGKVTADEDSELLITIPYDKNWICSVDGQETAADCIGSALMGIPLRAGNHTIRLRYIPDGLKMGAFISLLSLLIFILLFILTWRQSKKTRCTRAAR